MDASKLFHAGQPSPPGRVRQPPARRPAGEGDAAARPSPTSDRAFIEGAGFFFLATADAEGRPDCSFKGGLPGFVRVTGAERARLSRLRRQRHVQEPRQPPGQPGRRAAVHRHGREAAAAPGQRHGDGRARRPAARRASPGRSSLVRVRGAGDLPELPALHPRPRRRRRSTRRAPASSRSSPPGRGSRSSATWCRRGRREREERPPNSLAMRSRPSARRCGSAGDSRRRGVRAQSRGRPTRVRPGGHRSARRAGRQRLRRRPGRGRRAALPRPGAAPMAGAGEGARAVQRCRYPSPAAA